MIRDELDRFLSRLDGDYPNPDLSRSAANRQSTPNRKPNSRIKRASQKSY